LTKTNRKNKNSIYFIYVIFLLLNIIVIVSNNAVAQKPVSIQLNNSGEVCKKCNKIFSKNINEKIIDSIANEYVNCLKSNAFLASSVDSIKIKGDTILVYIYNNVKYKWQKLNFIDDNAKLINNIHFNNQKFTGKPINYNAIIKIKSKILSNYENNGYPFVSIKTDSLEVAKGFISANYQVISGDLITFDSLEIIGNIKLSQSYLEHYLGVINKKIYNEKKVRLINQRIKELPFLLIDKPTEIYFINKSARIRLFLKPKKANQFNGILGVTPDSKTPGKILLTGDISLNLINSFKIADQIEFSWKKLETSSQNLYANIQLPYLFNKPIGAQASIKLFKKDSTYLNVTTHLGLPFYLSGNNNIGVYYENSSSTLLSTTELISATTLPNVSGYHSNIFGLSVNLSSLDYKFNPRKGLQVRVQAGYGEKIIEKQPQINPLLYNGVNLTSFRNELFADISNYTNIFGKFVLKLRVQTGYINTKTLLKNELYRIGGVSTLRGFDEESIYASAYGIASSELRYLFEENSAFFAFYDQGYYKSIDIKVDNPAGFGAGIEFQTKAGIFTLSYALGHQLGNSVQFRAARVHFGFVNRF